MFNQSCSELEGWHQPEQLPPKRNHRNLGARTHLWKYGQSKSSSGSVHLWKHNLKANDTKNALVQNPMTMRGKFWKSFVYSQWHWPTWNRWISTQGSNYRYNYACGLCRKCCSAELKISCNIVAIILWFPNNRVHSFYSRKTNLQLLLMKGHP